MTSINHRHQILVFMKLLSSTGALERLARQTGEADVADRLCTLWINELYLPGLRYRDGLKGDRSRAAVREFESCFSAHELALLEQFHRFLELRLEMLPKRLPEEQIFPGGAFWQSIVAHAGRILEEIDPEGLEVDEITETVVEALRRVGPRPQ